MNTEVSNAYKYLCTKVNKELDDFWKLLDYSVNSEQLYSSVTVLTKNQGTADYYYAVVDRFGREIRKFGQNYEAASYFAQGCNHFDK